LSLAYHLKRFATDHGADKAAQYLTESVQSKKIDSKAFRLPEMVRHFLGEDYLTAHRAIKAIQMGQSYLLEDVAATDASAFANITGQLLITLVKEAYQSAEFIGDKLFRTIPNPGGNLKEHKVPYLSDVLDEPKKLAAQEPYPYTTFTEGYVTMPEPEKYGRICAIDFEMLFSDLTGQAQDRATSVGRVTRYLKEKRQLRVALGIVNNHVFQGTAMNTYLTAADAVGLYVNRIAAQTITNFTHISAIENLFWAMVDPLTGREIYIQPKLALCMPEKRYELKRVLHAKEVRDATTGTHQVTDNPLDTNYEVVWSQIAKNLLDSETSLSAAEIKEYVILGDFQRAFMYREVYPLDVQQAPPNNPDEFRQDIVMSVKASEYGVPFTYDPRMVVLSTSEAT
jgi:hypothetical protein